MPNRLDERPDNGGSSEKRFCPSTTRTLNEKHGPRLPDPLGCSVGSGGGAGADRIRRASGLPPRFVGKD